MDSLQIGGFRIDLDRELVIRPDGVEVRPRPQAFAVLRHLTLTPGGSSARTSLSARSGPALRSPTTA